VRPLQRAWWPTSEVEQSRTTASDMLLQRNAGRWQAAKATNNPNPKWLYLDRVRERAMQGGGDAEQLTGKERAQAIDGSIFCEGK